MSLLITRQGQGPDLVLVHGWGLGPYAWDSIIPRLAVAFTVHVVALPGYGTSAARPKASLAELADALARRVPTGATLCGWSLGGFIVLACAERHPAVVGRLILVGGNCRFIAVEGWPEALPAARLEAFTISLDRDPVATLKQFSRFIHQGDANARQAIRAMASCLSMGLPADTSTLRSGLDMLATGDLRDAVPRIAAAALIIHGGADPMMPLSGARRMATLLPTARMEIFTAAAHAPFASEPDRFAAAVHSFAASPS